MKNFHLGKVGAMITGISIVVFAVSMLISLATTTNTASVSYFVCIFIAIGYILLATSVIAPNNDKPLTAAGLAGVAFAAVYAVFIFIVYFAMLTTVRMNSALSGEVLSIISYEHMGSLSFNYNLLGYGFMALSTFFIGFTVSSKNKRDKILQRMLWIHGIFFVSGLLLPIFPLFTPDMAGGKMIGTLVLLIWCAYFLPICVLSWKYFSRIDD